MTRNADWKPYFETFDGVEMALVPAGCFDMGENGAGGRQCFDEPFWIGRYEVTNAQYKRCVDAGECTPPHDTTYYEDPDYADHPVVYVDWFQAVDYAKWRGSKLPTEAEWEYAARGPDALIFPWGNEFNSAHLNSGLSDDRYDETAPVSSFPTGASWVGALDMSGNVWEWVSSAYADYPYMADDGREDPGRTDFRGVLRGGAWWSFNSGDFRADDRNWYNRGSRNRGGGASSALSNSSGLWFLISDFCSLPAGDGRNFEGSGCYN